MYEKSFSHWLPLLIRPHLKSVSSINSKTRLSQFTLMLVVTQLHVVLALDSSQCYMTRRQSPSALGECNY
ncbi:hypothetical protein ANCCAN_13259, partial [Ancylostoma caninum]